MNDPVWQRRFTELFAAPSSAVQARIRSTVFGNEYPAAADPYSYISVTELNRFTRDLNLHPGELLADLGCGRGPSLWVASHLNACLIGIDLAPTPSKPPAPERKASDSRRSSAPDRSPRPIWIRPVREG